MLMDELDAKQLWGYVHVDTKSMENETNHTLQEERRERERGKNRGERERGKKRMIKLICIPISKY